MLLSYTQLMERVVKSHVIYHRHSTPEGPVRTEVNHEHVNATSIDITLGRYLLVESDMPKVVSLRERTPLNMHQVDLAARDGFLLEPGQFVLGQSCEMFDLPDNLSAEYKLKSSMARIGLEHLTAGWCDAGWNSSVLTLEFRNMTKHHGIILRYGDRIGQMVFFSHAQVPSDRSYASRGRYNGDVTVTAIKR